ncbi:MAG: tyrosine-type recombinase/integrase [Candidatus Acidiferrales bacterium]
MRQRGVYEKLSGSGTWWIRYADTMGSIRREKAGPKSAALTLYRKRKTEALQGKKLPESLRAPGVSFAELAHDALVYSKTHKRTYEDDALRMPWLLAAFRERPADSITPQDLEHHLARISEERNWAPASVNRYRALMSLIFRLGIENGKVKENPARLVKPRLVNNARTRWLSAEEEARLRAAIEVRHPEHMVELELALNTGLRLSEMYGLTWENVNLSRRVLTIPRSKNGEMRHVPINSSVMASLLELRKRGDGTGGVVRNPKGEPLADPRHWFEPAIRLAKIRDFSWHCLRHTFASRLVMAGVDLRTVQELLGHKNIAMTVRYSHLAPAHTLAAVERLARAYPDNPTDTRTSTGATEQAQVGLSYVQ